MQVTDPDLLAYLKHRIGDQKIRARQPRIIRKALELNRPSPDFARTFGDSELPAYVGFLDLAGFSDTAHGKRPRDIAHYLKPFLVRVIDILRGRGVLIDKTIGDEVMFILPETEEEEQSPEILFLGQAMGALHDLAYELEEAYRYRIGLAYGPVSFFHIEGSGYSEWTAVGETVHVAKRLHDLRQLSEPKPVCGAFGMGVDQADPNKVRAAMEVRLSLFAGYASRFDHEFLPDPVPLKGVGGVLCALLVPRPERAERGA